MIVAFIASGLHYGSVLVHCQRGVSRSATAVLFYLMSKQGMKYDDALALVQRKRHVVNPIESFRSQLVKYELQCKEKGLIKDKQDGKKTDDRVREGKSKKRKMMGPSIGPQKMLKNETNGSSESQSKKEGSASNNDEKLKSSKDNSAKRSIGPTLPPGFKRG